MKKQHQSSGQEPRQRLQAVLRGAFAGPPTSLKDIPKKNGESRAKQSNGMSSQSKKRRGRYLSAWPK
jgi:hypothetical protein